jgi:hypothetical protein
LERRMRISSTNSVVYAVLTEENPKTADEVWKTLPITGEANRWGDEIYFSTPVSLREENARAEVEVGTIAYWPPGKAVCIFFGKTPASKRGEPRAASPVNVFAKVVGDVASLRKVQDGEQVILAKSDTA